jgi:HEAT repeat protein
LSKYVLEMDAHMLNWLRKIRPSKKPGIQPHPSTPSTSLWTSGSARPPTSQKPTANQGPIEDRQPVLVRGEFWKNTIEVRRELPREPEAFNDTDVTSLVKGLARLDRTEIRRSAAESLGQWGPAAASAIPHLIVAAIDVEASVREAALKSLNLIDPAWPKHPEARQAFPKLVTALRSWSADVTSAAYKLLHIIGLPAVPALVAALATGDDTADKISIIHLLTRLGSQASSAVPELTRKLSSHFLQARIAAAEALTAIGPAAASAVPALITGLSDSYADARQAMAVCLGQLGPAAEPAIPALVRLLADRQARVREAAELALERLGPVTIPALIALLEARDAERKETWQAAKDKVSNWSPHPLPGIAVIERDKFINNMYWATYEIVADLTSPEIAQLSVLQLLGKFGPAAADAVPAIVPALADPNPGVVSAAAEILGQIGPLADYAVPSLLKVLAYENETLRKTAAAALHRIDDEWAYQPTAVEMRTTLVRQLCGEKEHSEIAVYALALMGTAAVPALIEVLDSDDYVARINAASALGRIGAEAGAATSVLTKATHDKNSLVCDEALKALAKIRSG